MTKQTTQETSSVGSGLSRARRTSAAIALSVGVGSLVYGTVLSFPASAYSNEVGTPALMCTTTASPSAPSGAPSITATSSPSAAGSASQSTNPTSVPSTPAATTTQASASPSPTSCGVATSTPSGQPTPHTPTPTASKPKPSTPPTTPGKGGPSGKPGPGRSSQIPVYVVAPTGSYYAYTLVPPGDAAYQLPHGTITRAQIMTRAQLWIQDQVPYSQTAWFTDKDGTYRQDCSGYVSMAWDLNQYTDFWTGNLNLVSHTIPAAELEPGDILLSIEHTILFAGWADPQHTMFNFMEESHPGTVAHYVVDAPLAAFLDNGFAPFRYDGVADSAVLPLNPLNGLPYAALALKGSEINPPGVRPGRLPGLGEALGQAADVNAGATSTPNPRLNAQAAADVSANSDSRTDGMLLGIGGAFLVGAGLLMRRPVLQAKRRKH